VPKSLSELSGSARSYQDMHTLEPRLLHSFSSPVYYKPEYVKNSGYSLPNATTSTRRMTGYPLRHTEPSPDPESWFFGGSRAVEGQERVAHIKDELSNVRATSQDNDRPRPLAEETRKPTLVDSLPTSFVTPGRTYTASPVEILPFSYLVQDVMSYTSEDETEYSTDEMSDSLCSLDQASATRITTPPNIIRSVLSPIKQQLVDCIMKAFWQVFNNENEFSRSA